MARGRGAAASVPSISIVSVVTVASLANIALVNKLLVFFLSYYVLLQKAE